MIEDSLHFLLFNFPGDLAGDVWFDLYVDLYLSGMSILKLKI